MTHEEYLQSLRNEVREHAQLIQWMKVHQVPFARYDFLIYELRDLRIKLAEVEAIIAMENLRQITEN
jgi:hypothetical protein